MVAPKMAFMIIKLDYKLMDYYYLNY